MRQPHIDDSSGHALTALTALTALATVFAVACSTPPRASTDASHNAMDASNSRAPTSPSPSLAAPANAAPADGSASRPGAPGRSTTLGLGAPIPLPGELSRVAPSAAVDRSFCWFFWRKSVEVSFQPKDRHTVELAKAGDRGAFRLGEFDVDVQATGTPAGGHTVTVGASTKTMALSDHFELGSALTAGHLPAAGHGFTGLRYAHSAGKSELQYFCGSIGPRADVTDDALSQSAPGPSAPRDAFVRCAVTTTDATGVVESDRVVDVARARTPEQIPLTTGSFVASVGYLPGEEDSGSLSIGATLRSGEGFHDAIFVDRTDLPSNTFARGGFTGVRSLTDRTTGRQLHYQCSAVR